MLDDSIFDDPRRLAETDTAGLLRAAAFAGAQVRAVSEVAAESDLGDLADSRPRALVLLSRGGPAPGACRLLAALLGPTCPVPVVLAGSVPSWVGPLDVVFIGSDDGGDPVLAESAATAGRRGASVVLAAPGDGPLAAAAAGRATLLPPKIALPSALSFAHVMGAGLALLSALGLLHADTAVIADELDGAAARSHPRHETATNPAKALALRLADRIPLLWGLDEVSTAVGHHAAFVLGCHAALPCDVSGYPRAVSRHALHRSASSTGGEADLFADPHDDPGPRPRAFLLTTRADEHARNVERAAVAALPSADVLTPEDSASNEPLLWAMLQAVGFELASVYLGLASGTLEGSALSAH